MKWHGQVVTIFGCTMLGLISPGVGSNPWCSQRLALEQDK